MYKSRGRPKGGKNMKYEPEFKIKIAKQIASHELGFREAERIYNIHNCVLSNWHRIYLEEGEEGLFKERRGRSGKGGRPPKLEKKVEDDLITRNHFLEMENEYLKKLRDLVYKREQSEQRKQK